jgi:uncharacterized repeat protein (TIGR03803 family)
VPFHLKETDTVVVVAAICGLLITFNLAQAQPLQLEVLFNFNNGDSPQGLTLGVDGNLYGTTSQGGAGGFGQTFRLTANGVITTLVSFSDGTNTTNGYPSGLTVGADGNFYGTTSFFGSASLFQVTTNGALTTLYLSGGLSPSGVLTLGNDGAFYGTTFGGDFVGEEMIFRVTTNGELTTLHTFTNAWEGFGLVRSYLALGADGSFYGTTAAGGSYGLGTVFKAATNGVVSTLCSFALTNGGPVGSHLTLGHDGNFYGASVGDSSFDGSVFRVTTNGLLTTLASFAGTNGTYPFAGLTLGSDGNFYGTTYSGGKSNYGTAFQVTTNGELTTLISFVGTNGFYPGELSLGTDGNFYGTTSSGGAASGGVIFRLRRGASFQSFGMTTNGFQLNTLNVGGSGWVILESSSDLMTWTPIQTNGTAAAQTFLDPAALIQPRQFYRVRQL